MTVVLKLGVLLALWLFSRRRSKSGVNDRISRLSWPAKVQLGWRLVRDNLVPRLARASAFLPVLYLISPIDLLPDFIPILGRLDDALVFGVVIDLLVRSVPAPVLIEHLDNVSSKP